MTDEEYLAKLQQLKALQEEAKTASAEPPEPNRLPGFAKESLQRVGSGAISAAGSLADAAVAGPMGPLRQVLGIGDDPITGLVRKFIQKSTKAGSEKIDSDLDKDSMWSKAMSGAGAALGTPIPGASLKSLFPQALTGAAGGMGAEAGGNFAEGISPKLRPMGEVLGGVATGGPLGFLLGPKQGFAQRDIKRATTGMKPADFDEAVKAAKQAQSVGITTGTAPEMFSPNSAIMDLGKSVRGGTLENPMRAQTMNRETEARGLGTEFLNRILNREVDPNSVANRTADAAGSVIQTAKGQRNTGIRNRLANEKPVPPQDIAAIEKYLLSEANANGISPGRAAAFREAASKLRDSKGQILTNPQDLSLRLVEMQNAPKNPNFTGFQGTSVTGVEVAEALKNTREAISAYRPGFGEALDDFGSFSKGVLEPMKAGPVGSLADRNPLLAGQTPVSRLEGLVTGNSPQTVGRTAQQLSDPATAGANAVSPLEIARALEQQKLRSGTANPGAVVRGAEGSPQQAQLEALLKAGGKNPGEVMAPLSVADRLQSFQGPAGTHELPRTIFGPRVLRNIDMWNTGRREATINKELAELLKDGSPEGIRRLQEIAMFNPAIRKMLSAKGAFLPALTQDTQE